MRAGCNYSTSPDRLAHFKHQDIAFVLTIDHIRLPIPSYMSTGMHHEVKYCHLATVGISRLRS